MLEVGIIVSDERNSGCSFFRQSVTSCIDGVSNSYCVYNSTICIFLGGCSVFLVVGINSQNLSLENWGR